MRFIRWDCSIRHPKLQKRGEFKVVVSTLSPPCELLDVLNVRPGSLLCDCGAVSLARCAETRPDRSCPRHQRVNDRSG